MVIGDAYRVRGHDNLFKRIVPFFEKHKLKTKKRVDFEKFRVIILLMERKTHLTAEGLERIIKIAGTMNTKSSPMSTLERSESSQLVETKDSMELAQDSEEEGLR